MPLAGPSARHPASLLASLSSIPFIGLRLGGTSSSRLRERGGADKGTGEGERGLASVASRGLAVELIVPHACVVVLGLCAQLEQQTLV